MQFLVLAHIVDVACVAICRYITIIIHCHIFLFRNV